MTAAVPPRSLFWISLRRSASRSFGIELAGAPGGAHRDALGLEAPGAGDVQAVDHLVAPAVVGAADLDDVLLAGERARHADGGHDRLGAGAEHAEHLDGRHEPVDELGQLELVLVEQAGHRARTR